jgi:hypothetical protein
LARYAQVTADARARQAAERAAQVFLCRRLYKRRSDGQIMRPAFVKLHYPSYWHYDFLHGLKVMAEAGFIQDPRCQDALDLLQSKQLPEGGWHAEGKHYTVFKKPGAALQGGSRTGWGETARSKMNEYVTVDALFVLRQAGRL